MGGFTYPSGMAATKRIQNIITALKSAPNVTTRVILQRQSSSDNPVYGSHEGTPYEIIFPDLFRSRLFLLLPVLHYKTIKTLRGAYRPDCKNIIYFYGPLFLDSIVPLSYAKKLGFKIVFDVIEDFGLAKDISHSYYQYARSMLANKISSQIKNLADGIIVISSYLEDQCRKLTDAKTPMHYMSVSVDMVLFSGEIEVEDDKPTKVFLYAGSFGKKDGLSVLLDAFDKLAEQYSNIRLVLTGKGEDLSMQTFYSRLEESPHKDKIDYRGYLDDESYYSLLNSIDFPCMTRVDLAFANAGFPFKLGEFLATGKPVIASKVSDVDRFIVDRENAMLVEPNSVEEVCKAAEYLLNNPDRAKEIGENGREAARKHFDNIQQSRDFLDFIQTI